LEGRTSLVNHNAIGGGGRNRAAEIANRLASIANGRIVVPMAATGRGRPNRRREAMIDAIRRQLQSWLDFFSGADSLNAPAAQALAPSACNPTT